MSDRHASLLRYLRFWGPNIDGDIDDELRYHVEMRIADFVAQGFTPEQARTEALRVFGDLTAVASQLRAHDAAKLRTERRADMLQDLAQDIRYGVRKLAQAPGFTAAVVLVLALGIGANTAVFSAVDAAFFRPLPFFEPERLVSLPGVDLPIEAVAGNPTFPKSAPTLDDVRAERDVFDRVAAYATGGLNLTGGAAPVHATISYVTPDFFPVLGRLPILGRSFVKEEGSPGAPNAVVISYALWQRQFGGDSHITQRRLELNDVSYAVVGVMPPNFGFPEQTDVWIALQVPIDFSVFAAFRNYLPSYFVARLAPGATLPAAASRMEALCRRFLPPQTAKSRNMHRSCSGASAKWAAPLQDALVGESRTALLILMGSALMLLLIACANVTNLLLARASTRHREIAVRMAIGATRLRIMRQMTVESALLCFAGAVAAIGVAWLSLGALRATMPASLIAVSPPRVDARIFAFTVLVALVTSFIVGIWPAVGASKVELNDAIKSGAVLSGRQGRVSRGALVVAEISVALMLVIGAGLLMESFYKLRTVDTGIQTDHLMTARLTIPGARYATSAAKAMLIQSIASRVASLPGVTAAGAVNTLPMEKAGGIAIRTQPEGAEDDTSRAAMGAYLSATPGYFRALGSPLRGSELPATYDSTHKVIVINETMAKRMWPNQDPIGRRLVGVGGTHTVIGVVADIRARSVADTATAQMYFPMAEMPQSYVSVIVRGDMPTDRLIAAIHQAVLSVDPREPIYEAQSMDDVVSASIAPRRTNTILLTAFGSLALLLSGIGVYAVLAYGVEQRRREIGVRMALGAQRRDVLRLVVGQGAMLAVVGVAIGLGASFALTRFLASVLYDVGTHDRGVFVAAPIVLLIVALFAAWLPALRATRVTPLEALSES